MLRVHKWCGLTACLLILVQAATGIVNAFRHDLAQLLDPDGMVRQVQDVEAPLAEIFRSLHNSHSDLTLERLEFPEKTTGIYLAHMLDPAGARVYASIDPGSAEVLRSGSIWGFPTEAAKRIHYNYIIGIPGLFMVSITGLLALLLAATGVAYWWPRHSRISQVIRINWNAPGKFVLRQVHRSTGVTMTLLVGFSLVTGLVLSIDYIAAGTKVTAVSQRGVSTNPDFNVDDVVQQARRPYPDHDIRDIRFVSDNRVNVFFRSPEYGPLSVSLVGVDLYKKSIVTTLDAGFNNEIWVTWLPLHSGKTFGVVGTVLVTINALVLIGLALSGPFMWYTRVRSRRKRKSRSRTI